MLTRTGAIIGVMLLAVTLAAPAFASALPRDGPVRFSSVQDSSSREASSRQEVSSRQDTSEANTSVQHNRADNTANDSPVLQVTGHITNAPAVFSRDALEVLPRVQLVTSTVVTDGQHVFSGFLVRDLLAKLGAQGSHVTAVALNDYAVDIPMEDFQKFDVIVADHMDGEPLGRDDKGPLWIVYPRDDHEVLQDIRYDYRWVWQLYQLEVQ